jgi:hypothetical protein
VAKLVEGLSVSVDLTNTLVTWVLQVFLLGNVAILVTSTAKQVTARKKIEDLLK